MSEKLYEYRTLNIGEAIYHLMKTKDNDNWKLHRWDGPAIEPLGKNKNKNKEYYLNGVQYERREYQEIMNEREGLPYYKDTSLKHLISDYRN